MKKISKEKRKRLGIYFLTGAASCFVLGFLIYAIGYRGFFNNIITCLMPICVIVGLVFLIASFVAKED